MNLDKFTSIKNLANLFLNQLAVRHSLPKPVNNGVVRAIIADTDEDRKFFYNEMNKDYTADDFDLFKTFIYGIGEFKFSYNEKNMNSEDHSICHTVYDVFQLYQQKVSIKNPEFTSVWVSYLNGYKHMPSVFSTIPAFILHEIFKISQAAEKEILEYFKNKMPKDESIITQQMFNDYHQKILFQLQREFTHKISLINDKFALEIANKFSNQKTLFVERSLNCQTYIFPNKEAQQLISINSFYNDLNYFNILSVEDLHQAVQDQAINIKKMVRQSFELLFKEHKSMLNTELEIERKSTYLLVKPDNED